MAAHGMSSLWEQQHFLGLSHGAPASERATLYNIHKQSGQWMLIHLSVIPKQVTESGATGADRIWPPGTHLQASRPGLFDPYVGYRAAQGDIFSSLVKKLLKWVRARFISVWYT